MNWMVTSSIHGGTQYAPATRERYTAAVASLRNQAKEMKGAGFFWSVAHDQLRKDRAGAAFCPALAGSGGDGEPGHVSMPYARLLEQCVTHARECATLAGDLEQVADLIARAHSLYDEAETKAETKLRKAAQIMTTVLPSVGWNTLGMLSLYGFVSGSIKDGKLNPVRALDATSKMDEELLASLAGRITNNRIAHILGGTQVAPRNASQSTRRSSRTPCRATNSPCVRCNPRLRWPGPRIPWPRPWKTSDGSPRNA